MEPLPNLLSPSGTVSAQTLARFRPALYRFIRRKGFGHEEADDLTQETLLRACQHLPRFRGTHLSAWLYRIASNLCVDYSRKHRVATVPLGEELVAVEDPDPAEVVARAELYGAIRAVISALPECHRRILWLRFFEGKSMADIAGQVHCSPLAAKLRVFRAVSALRRAWREIE